MVRCRRPLILSAVAAAAALSLLAAGCGGGGSPGVARVAASTGAATTAATTTVQYGANGAQAGALGFARCMRSHGIPTPDPEPNGTFDKRKLRQLLGGISQSRVRAVEDRFCHYVFQNGGQSQTISPAEQADYLRAAACMRRHGFPGFPDPTFQNGHVTFNVPPSVDTNPPKARRAVATCQKLIPAGLPYSRSSGS
jgi:hypothetical protein